MSEYDWVKWILAFAELSVEANSDMKLRMSLLKKAARKRLEYLEQGDTAVKELLFTAADKENP